MISCAQKLVSLMIAFAAFSGNSYAQFSFPTDLTQEKSQWELRQTAAESFDEHKLEYLLHLRDVRSLLDPEIEDHLLELGTTSSREVNAEDFFQYHTKSGHVSKMSSYVDGGSQSGKKRACMLESSDLSYSARFACVHHELKKDLEGGRYWSVGSIFSAAVTTRTPIADSFETKGYGRFSNEPNNLRDSAKTATIEFDLNLSSTGVITARSENILLSSLLEPKNLSLPEKILSGIQGVFVRNAEILEASVSSSHIVLTGMKNGETELFIVTHQGISIVPVIVGKSQSKSNIGLAVNTHSKPKLIPGDFQLPATMSKLDILDDLVASENRKSAISNRRNQLSSVSETIVAQEPDDLVLFTTDMSDVENMHTSFRHTRKRLDFVPLKLRLVDDRTSPDQSAVYPVGGQIVQLSGSNFQAVSDSKGFVTIPDMPIGSRILAQIYDPGGKFAPTVAELIHHDTQLGIENVQWIKLKRAHVLELDHKMASVTPISNQGSVCLTIIDEKKQGVSGVRIGTNRRVEGIFYFGSRGLVDPKKRETDSSGRVCIFNAESGGLTLGLAGRGSREMISVTVAITAGRHLEEEISIGQKRSLTASVAQVSTATEQLSSDSTLANRYTVIDGAEIMPIGSSELMVSLDDGVFATTSDVLPIRGRTWTVSQSGEHELSVQAMPLSEDKITKPVVTMIPRGFIEDMMYFAQEDHNLDLSSVVVEHAYVEGQSKEPVKIKLIDPFGRDVGKGWYYSDQPVTKAIFFDVPTGVYSIYVESSAGQWIASDTIVTYPQTTTMVHSGAKLGAKQETAFRSQ